MLRKAFVANQFYPGDPKVLEKTVNGYMGACKIKKQKACAIIAPHAGYIYSGKTAGCVYSVVDVPDTVVLIGPNHTGLGEMFSIMDSGAWETPLGKIPVNADLAHLIMDNSRLITTDLSAHSREHSLEVQLPFLQKKNPDVSIVPLTVMGARFRECEEVGNAIAHAISAYKEDVLLVISSDMNHYESEEVTRKKDKLAIDKVLSLDAEGLLKVTREKDITMCGAFPAAIGIVASLKLGCIKAKLLSHTTSGETSGDYKHVVGYAGFVIS